MCFKQKRAVHLGRLFWYREKRLKEKMKNTQCFAAVFPTVIEPNYTCFQLCETIILVPT